MLSLTLHVALTITLVNALLYRQNSLIPTSKDLWQKGCHGLYKEIRSRERGNSYFSDFQGVEEKFKQMKFLAAIFKMQIMKRDTLISFQKFHEF